MSNDEPKLLSGGNPQIPKGDGDGPVSEYLAAMPGWKQVVGKKLDEIVAREVPAVRKAVRWNTPFYGVEGQGWFLGFHCLTKYLKVSFLNGADLSPLPPIAARHDKVRYLHIFENDNPDEELLAGWIRQASTLPGQDLF